MARIRSIKPDFFRHEGLYQAEVETGLPLRVAFAGLWTACDREGRFEWRPAKLKLDCLPYDQVDFSRVLDALATRGFVVRYASGGVEYGYVPSWRRHQVINNRESASQLPEPNKINDMSTRQSRVDDACPTRQVHAQAEGEGEGELKKLHPLPELETPDPGQPAAGALPAEAGTATPKPGSVAVQAAAALDALRVTPPVGSDAHDRAGELWGVLAANGCRGTAAHPSVIEMARSGVTVAELRSAIAEARKSNPGQLNPAYLAAIVSRFRTDPPKAEAAGWKTDDAKAEALCRQLGIRGAKAGEDRATWHARITAAMASKAQQQVA